MPDDPSIVSHAAFNLVYDGPALQGNQMAVRDLSAALIAADSLFLAADSVLNGGRTDARLTVKASFKSGSFGIEFDSMVSLAERLRDIFASETAGSIVNAAGIFGLIFGSTGLFALLKWLRRRKPTRIEHRGGKVVFLVGKQFFEAEQRVLELFRDFKVRQALEEVVTAPLRKEGITDFAVIRQEAVIATAIEDDADDFVVDVFVGEGLEETTRETWLNIVSAAFKPGDKWRFNDGGANFYASVSDPGFVAKVLSNDVEFGIATRLRVRLRELQYTDNKGILHKESDIEQVLEIKKPDKDLTLLLGEVIENDSPEEEERPPLLTEGG